MKLFLALLLVCVLIVSSHFGGLESYVQRLRFIQKGLAHKLEHQVKKAKFLNKRIRKLAWKNIYGPRYEKYLGELCKWAEHVDGIDFEELEKINPPKRPSKVQPPPTLPPSGSCGAPGSSNPGSGTVVGSTGGSYGSTGSSASGNYPGTPAVTAPGSAATIIAPLSNQKTMNTVITAQKANSASSLSFYGGLIVVLIFTFI